MGKLLSPDPPLGFRLNKVLMSSSSHCCQRIIGLLLIMVGLPVLAVAQLNNVVCKAPSQRGSLGLTVEAKQVGPPVAPLGDHLVVVSLPSENQIDVPDPGLKAAIKAWVDSQNAVAEGERRVWILDGKNHNSGLFTSQDPKGLKKALESAFTISFTPLSKPSPSPAQQNTVSFCFVAAAPPATVKGMDVLVSTRPLIRGPAAGAISFDLLSPASGVTAHALVMGQDFSNDAEKGHLLKALAEVAKTAYDVAKEEGLVIGSAPSLALLRRIEISILERYSLQSGTLPGLVWPLVDAHIEFDPQTNNFVLKVGNLTMAKSSRVQVDLGITPASAKGLARANKLAGRSQDLLEDRFAARLAALTNAVPTVEQLDSLSSDIAVVPQINPSSTPVLADPNDPKVLVFHADNRWIKFGFKLSAQGGYSPEEKAIGALTFEGDNLLPPIPDNLPDKPRQTESLSYKGGNQVQKVNALWAIDWTHDFSSQAIANYGIHVSGDYLQDSEQRFGNLQSPPFRDRERGVKVTGVYSFRSRPTDDKEEPLSQRYGLNAALGLEYRHVNVDPASGSVVPPLATGSMTAAFLDLTLNYRYEPVKPKPGIGGLELTLTSQAINGFSTSDFSFTQVLIWGQGTLYFGSKHPRDYFLRFRQGVGTSNPGTPLFKLFRLGGTDILRGIEQGEFVGRKIGYQQFEAGVSGREIISWFSGKPKAPIPGDKPAAPPIDLSKIYLKGFYDRGRVNNNAGFSDLIGFRHAAKGYGVAVEIQTLPTKLGNVTMTIGYARSPDSVLHRSGLPITGVSISF